MTELSAAEMEHVHGGIIGILGPTDTLRVTLWLVDAYQTVKAGIDAAASSPTGF